MNSFTAHTRKLGRLLAAALFAALSLLGAGCIQPIAISRQTVPISFVSRQGTNEIVRIKKATSWIIATGDARNEIGKVRVSSGKTSSIGLTDIDQQTTTTNLSALLEAATAGAVRGLGAVK